MHVLQVITVFLRVFFTAIMINAPVQIRQKELQNELEHNYNTSQGSSLVEPVLLENPTPTIQSPSAETRYEPTSDKSDSLGEVTFVYTE